METLVRSNASLSDTLLDDNCIIGGATRYCAICTGQPICVDWLNHIKKGTHVATLRRFELIFHRRSAGVYCKACGLQFDWIWLKSHAKLHKITPWYVPQNLSDAIAKDEPRRGRKKKKSHRDEPEILIERDASLDAPVNAKSRGVGLARSAEYFVQRDVCGLKVFNLPCDACTSVYMEKYPCKICNVNIDSEINFESHILGKRHSNGLAMYSCDNIYFKDNVYHCKCCDVELANCKIASEHIEHEEHIGNASLPCISIVPTNTNQFHCSICKVDSNGVTNLQTHANGSRHAAARKQYGCDIVSFENNRYYCGCCDRAVPSRKLASEHIHEEKHLRNVNLPCISIAKMETNLFRCVICKIDSNSETDLWTHVNGSRHTTARKRYGCDNMSIRNGKYFCTCCDFELSSRKLATDHIQQKKHAINANLPCISVALVDTNLFHCRLCKVNSTSQTDLDTHLNGHRHSALRKKYGCDNISLKNHEYFCRCCDSTLSSRKLASDHIEQKYHLSNSANVACVSVTMTDENLFGCKVCKVDFDNEADFRDHVNRTQHAIARKKHGCDEILPRGNNNYYCRCCDVTLSSRELASNHIDDENHLNNVDLPCISIVSMGIDGFHCRICRIDCHSRTDLEIHVDGIRHAIGQKHYGCDVISLRNNLYFCRCCDSTFPSRKLASDHLEEDRHLSNANLPCISVISVDGNRFRCKICRVDCDNGTDLQIHVNGIRHATAKIQYGCDNISTKNNEYFCRCCDSTFPSRKLASDHLQEDDHITNANLPCISIVSMPVNRFHCRICKVHSKNAKDLWNHVNESAHEVARNKYGCDRISLKNNEYFCNCCNVTMPNRQLASDHIEHEEHVLANADLFCIAVTLINGNEFRCRICKFNSYDPNDLLNHVNEKRHESALKRYGCDRISLKNDEYFCHCCDFVFSNRKLASDHVENKNHITNANLPCISIILTDANVFHCVICEINSNSVTDSQKHVNGNRHFSAQIKYGCNDIALNNNEYHCKCCNSTMSTRKLAFDHIVEKKRAIDREQLEKKLEKTCEEVTNKDLPYPHVFESDPGFYYCAICDCEISGLSNVKQHTDGSNHKIGIQLFVDNKIRCVKNGFRCLLCDCSIADRAHLNRHINQAKHLNLLKSFDVEENLERETNKKRKSEKPVASTKPTKKSKKNSSSETIQKENNEKSVASTNPTKKSKKNSSSETIEKENNEKSVASTNTTKKSKKNPPSETIEKENNEKSVASASPTKKSKKNPPSETIEKENNEKSVASTNPTKKSKKNPPSETIEKEYNEKSVASASPTKKSKKNPPSETIENENNEKPVASTKPTKRSRKRNKFGSEKGPIECEICNSSVIGAENYHIHMAQHFCEDNVSYRDNDVETESSNGSSLSRKTEPNDAKIVFESLGPVDPKNPSNLNIINRKTKVEKSTKKQLPVDTDFIYSIDDKSADMELGMKLRYPIDADEVSHCLICDKLIAIPLERYHEHLRSLEHCENLDIMERDHKLFKEFHGQFSQLDLSMDYMRECDDTTVFCLACDRRIDNVDDQLRDHINDNDHKFKCVKLRTEARERFQNTMKMKNCDWYEVKTYWCVPCSKKYESDFKFVNHLLGKDHADVLKKKTNAERKLVFDCCEYCALLWYGYRCTLCYHCESKTHLWLMRDGYHTKMEVPIFVDELLRDPDDYVAKTAPSWEVGAMERKKEEILIRNLEDTVRTKFSKVKAHVFGSRITGLESEGSDIDVFLDCENTYFGDSWSTERVASVMNVINECLDERPELWNVERILTTCRTPVIRVHHEVTGLPCDISVENGIAVENTLLIKYLNDICPSCQKMIIVLKQWLKLCELSGSERITSYALCWYVIFFLQKENILPSIGSMIPLCDKSASVPGWKMIETRKFSPNELECKSSLKQLLMNFFTFYGSFDYRRDVACPLLGETLAKSTFGDPRGSSSEDEMETHESRVKSAGECFRIDSIMCIQDPFDLEHNLTKAVSKVQLNRFRNYCKKSALMLQRMMTQS